MRGKAEEVSDEKLRTLWLELASFYGSLAKHAERIVRWKGH